MHELLQRSAHLPEVSLAPGDLVVKEGERSNGLWILVSGQLRIEKAGMTINTVRRPGAAIGEISLLLDAPHGATVVASEASVVRHAADGHAFLADPAVMRLVAAELAERLNFVSTYLADLKNQYGDSPGLAMVSDVLRHLAHRQGPAAQAGSARDPDPDY